MEEHKNKRYKLSGNSSFNTRDSGEGSLNLNCTAGDEEDQVREVRLSRPVSRDQKRGTEKWGHRRHLQQLALRAGNPIMDQRQKDEALYMSTIDEELNAVLRARWNIPF
nr:hypothetical protein [Tanacetum cinerariifolium]